MFSREGKYFILFFVLFSFLIISTSWFEYGSLPIPGLSNQLNFFHEETFELNFPDDWEKKNELGFRNGGASISIKNRAQENKKVKLNFKVFPVNGKRKLQIKVNGKKIGNFTVYDYSSFTTTMFELDPGKNEIEIVGTNCEGECFKIEKKSIRLLCRKEIEEKKIFFAKNWLETNSHKKMKTPAELHIYNSDDMVKNVRMSFRGVSPEKTNETILLTNSDKVFEHVKFDANYKFYQSHNLRLVPGENVFRFLSEKNISNLVVDGFDLVKTSEGELDFGKGWYPIESWYHEGRGKYLDFHWMGENATVYYYNSENHSVTKNIMLEVSSYIEPKILEIFLNGERIEVRNLKFTLNEGRDMVNLKDIRFEPGENEIEFNSKSGCIIPDLIENNSDDRCLSIAFYNIEAVEEDLDGTLAASKNLDPQYQYYFLIFLTILLILSLLIHFRKLKPLSFPDKKIIFALIVVFLFAFALRAFKPKTYQLYIDEPWNVEVANNLYRNQSAELCSYQGGNIQCINYPKPIGFPFYLYMISLPFQINLTLVFWNSILLGSLTCVLVFILGYLITEKFRLSFLASLIFSINPVHIFWSTTAESYVTSFFFILSSITLLYYYFKTRSWKILFTAFVVMLYSVPFRPENILMLFLFPILLFFEGENKKWKSIFKNRNIILFGLFVFNVLLYSKIFLSSLSYYRNITRIVPLEITNYLSLDFHIFGILLFLLVGFGLLWSENRRLFRFLGVWVILFTPTLIFHTGTDRMLIPLILTLSFILATVFDFFISKAERHLHRKIIFFAIVILILLIGIGMPVNFENTKAKTLQTDIIASSGQNIPKECYIVTEHPTLFSTWKNRVMPTEYVLNNSDYIKNLASRDCVLFFEGLGCELNIDRLGWDDNCRRMLEVFEMEKYKEYRKENISYNFYRIKGNQNN